MNAYRVKVLVKNNKLLSAIENCGYSSMAKFAKDADIPYETVIGLVGMRIAPLKADGEIKKVAAAIMELLGASLEDLWTTEQLTMKLKHSSAEKSVGTEEFRALLEVDNHMVMMPSLEDDAVESDRSAILHKMLSELPPRLQKIMTMRYLDDLTLAQVAPQMGVSKQCVGYLEAKAIRLLRSKSRGHKWIREDRI
jgi:RNA polymerase sigma factor (sigma-70 family)